MNTDQKILWLAAQLGNGWLKAMNEAGKADVLQNMEQSYRDSTGKPVGWPPDRTGL